MPPAPIHEDLELALQHHRAGRLADAEALYRKILAVQPEHAGALHLLGVIAAQAGRYDLAVEWMGRALVLNPNDATAHCNLGKALAEQGRHDEALDAYRRALQLQPDLPEAQLNLGNALRAQGHLDEAAAAYRRVLQLRPDLPEACINLGHVLRGADRPDEAVAQYRRALELQPDYPGVHGNLGNALNDCGQLDEAITAYRRELQLRPDQARVHSDLIYTLHSHPGQNRRTIAEEHGRWNRQFSDPLQRWIRPHPNHRDPERRLRIGYVSPAFRSDSISFFFAPLIENHDHRSFEIYCYASIRLPDAITERLRKSADVWRDVRALSDAQLTELVRGDGIDILVDLSMHTADHRLLAFARKPAPVQVSWLAYPGSTGLETIDFRLTDAHIDPPDHDDPEPWGKAVRLPDAWCCYAPIEDFPPVGPLPAAQSGIVTFGSLHQFCKINDGVLRSWAGILGRVPASRLLLVCPEGMASERTHAFFAAYGIARERVELVARSPWAEYIQRLQRIDIALDPFPCNGMTTTCHLLWMGVPVVTQAGTTAVSRAGSSLLHAMGMSEWVARSEEEYIKIVTAWAADLPRLAELRRTLRSRMETSPLMDAPRFARHVEAAYRSMWRNWCAQGGSQIP